MNLIIGSHVSYNNKSQLLGSVKEALSYKANTFMFYTGAPQNTNRSVIEDSLTMEAYKLMKENNIALEKVIVHAPYIVNLANFNNFDFSVSFLINEVERCSTLGIKYLVLHPGSAVNCSREEAINNISKGLNLILDNDYNVTILLETMAGKGNEMGKTFEELKAIIDKIKHQDKIGVCIDTCHLNDAGYDMSNFDEVLDNFDKVIGINKIGCIHVNDSKNEISSHKDRHENIGFGTIGFDNLIKIIKNMREFIISKGGKFLFNTKFVDFETINNKISKVHVLNLEANSLEKIETDTVILAIGHSSRDTFEKIYEKGLLVEPKNFSVGVRIEHLQSEINKSQYGTITKLNLPSADYKLAYHSPSGRSCYTFCMCPGGVVMASSSEKNTIVTNGMSYFARDGINANSAVLVNVVPSDFNSNSPLAGIYFQKDLEEKAFKLGGSNYFAPIQRFEDFANNKKSEFIGSIKPSYIPGVTLTNLNDIMPEFVSKTLKEGIIYFDTKLHGFANPDAIMTGMETRSSSPVKILRNENLVSNIDGIYPCGEGAGYAGGIMSASVDGIKCAIANISRKP